MLDLTRLRVIDAVARCGSVTAAAKELSYSQPSVSHHLARLESETGAQLLQRVGRGVRLTPAGRLLADRAAEILGRIDAADAELSAHVGLNAGRVRLAGFSSAIGSLLPGAVAALARQHPNVQVTLTDARGRFKDKTKVTGDDGTFSVVLPEGDWSVQVPSTDGKTVLERPITVSGGLITDDKDTAVSMLTFNR